MRKKAVIFDFNGTMFFDTMFQLNAWNRVLEDYDMDPIPEQEYRDVLCGRGSEETVRYVWGENLTKEQSDEYRKKKKEYYQQLCLADRCATAASCLRLQRRPVHTAWIFILNI